MAESPVARVNQILQRGMSLMEYMGRKLTSIGVVRIVARLKTLAACALIGANACSPAAFGQAQKNTSQTERNKVSYFVDEAGKAGLNAPNIFGGVDTKKYIIETTGTGAAIFDYDNDGWPDIFIVNGTTLEPVPGAKMPTNHLFHNNHDGTFSDVTEKAGLAVSGW